MKGQIDLRTIKKEANKIENQGEDRYKILQNGEITVFGHSVIMILIL